MEHAELDSREWLGLVARLGGQEKLAASAREHRAFVRARGIRSAADLLRLILMYGPGGYSLRGLAALAAGDGIADVSDVAMLGRIRGAADWLEALCREQLDRLAGTLGETPIERPLRIVDASRLHGPGDRAFRLHLCYDARGARMIDAAITTTHEAEQLDRLCVVAGEIRLADRGYPRPEAIKDTLAAGADLVVRLSWKSLRLSHRDGALVEWSRLFEQAGAAGGLDLPILMHDAAGRFAPVPLRLVVLNKPAPAAAKARVKARRASRKSMSRTDPRTIAAADHIILLTSLQPDAWGADEIGRLYRLRWQIEMAIKRLKSLLHIDRLPAKAPDLARAWLHAHLLFALLVDDITARIGATSP